MVIEVREAPVPVRYRWSRLSGQLMSKVWYDIDLEDRHSLFACSVVTDDDHITVEFDNGQTVIVRAKK